MAGSCTSAREAAGVLVRVLNLSMGQDTGGQQGRLARAFRHHAPTWRYDSVVASTTFYPIEVRYREMQVRREYFPHADVVHLHNNIAPVARFRGARNKPLVINHHGTIYRIAPEHHWQEAEDWGALAIVSTLDLQAMAPERTTWAPTPYDLSWLASFRGPRSDDGVLRVAHAPTNRAVKSTQALLDAVKRLQRDGVAIELDLIERVKNEECLRRKGTADVYFDQVFLGYGCNAIEAWGMGIPVIAGVDPERAPRRMRQKVAAGTRDLMLETWGEMPFYEATEDTIADALVAMTDARTRAIWAERGLEHVTRWHDEAFTVALFQGIYERAVALRR